MSIFGLSLTASSAWYVSGAAVVAAAKTVIRNASSTRLAACLRFSEMSSNNRYHAFFVLISSVRVLLQSRQRCGASGFFFALVVSM